MGVTNLVRTERGRRDRPDRRWRESALVRAAARPAIEVGQLTRRYGRTVALDDLSLRLDRGVVGLLGPNGAGKTTLLSILATVAITGLEPSCRCSSYDPADPASADLEIRRAQLGFLPQDLGYHRHFTVAAFLDYVAILKEITNSRARHAEVARVLAAVDLTAKARARISHAYPGGMRRRLGLAQ